MLKKLVLAAHLIILSFFLAQAQTPVDEDYTLKNGLGAFSLPEPPVEDNGTGPIQDAGYEGYLILSGEAALLSILESPLYTETFTAFPFDNSSRTLPAGTYRFYDDAVTILGSTGNTSVTFYKVEIRRTVTSIFHIFDYGIIDMTFFDATIGWKSGFSIGDFCEGGSRSIALNTATTIDYYNIGNVSFSGPGVTGSTWNSLDANTGTNTLVFQETFDNGTFTDNGLTARILPRETYPDDGDITFCRFSGIQAITLTDNAEGLSWSAVNPPPLSFNSSSGQYEVDTDNVTAGTYSFSYANYASSSATCSAYTSATLTITDATLVNVPSDRTVCESDAAFTLAGSPSGGDWSGSISSSGVFTPSSAGPGVYTLIYELDDACNSSNQTSVTVLAKPIADAGGDLETCTGIGIQLSASGGSNYSWSPSGSLSNPNIANPVASPTTDTEYEVTVTDVNGCSDTDRVWVRVNSATANAGTNKTICIGEDVQLNGSGGTLYSWSNVATLNDSNISNPIASPTTTTDYTLTVTDSDGCQDTDVVRVTVNPLPTVIAGSDLVSCEDDGPYNLNNDVSPLGGDFSGNGVSTNIFNPSAVIPDINHVITYTYTDGNGCENLDTRNVIVHALPTANAGADIEVCSTESGTLAASGGISYSWSPSTGLNNANIASPTVSPSATTTYTVTVTNSNGCQDTDQVVVRVNSAFANAGTNKSICIGESVQLNGSGGSIYSWNNGGTLSDSNINNPIASPTSTTNYTLTITDNNGCTDTDVVTVTVGGLPNVDAGSNLIFCADDALYNLNADVSPAGGTFDGEGVSGGIFDPGAVSTGVGHQITYRYTNSNGCANSDTRTITVNSLPVVDAGFDREVCVNDGLVSLTGASPSGGTWSGSGVSGTNFNPSNAGVGSHAINYQYTDGNGCVANDQIEVIVNSLSAVDAGADLQICINGGAVNLTGQTPSGGMWSGAAISSGIFDPSIGIGDYTATYTYTNSNGCISSDTRNIEVVNFTTVDAGADIQVCVNDGPYNLNGDVSVTGGEFSGTGVSGINFNPSSAGVGTYLITYTYNTGSGCLSSDTRQITVTAAPNITTGTAIEVCVAEPQFTLTGASPIGGTWSGTGVISGSDFNPGAAGIGVHILEYTYTDGNGCEASAFREVTVNALPTVSAGTNQSGCIDGGAISLVGGSPSGGTWSGSAVSGDQFLPSTSGIGSFTVTYNYTNNEGCDQSDTKAITVFGLPSVNAGPDESLCENGSVYNLSAAATPFGGTWSGPGVSGINFDPSQAGVGAQVLTYTYVDGNGCENSDTRVITVISSASVSLGGTLSSCVDDVAIDLSVYPSIVGGSWSGVGVSGNMFDPASAGIGTTTLTYSVVDGNGCDVSATKEMIVTDLPNVSAGNDVFICSGSPIVDLSSDASPAGGTWSGTGVTGSTFDGTSLGAGNYTATYDFTDGDGCQNSDSKIITLGAVVSVNAGPDRSVCSNEDAVNLSLNASPFGGTFSGPGVSGDSFDPSAGAGIYTITYDYTNSFGCSGSDQLFITVRDLPTPNAGSANVLCLNEAPLDLTVSASPSGGVFIGTGVISGSTFDPSIAGVGDHPIVYQYTDGFGCIGEDIRTVTVIDLEDVNAGDNLYTCVTNGLINLDQDASPATGVWSGTGVTFGFFDPAVAGVGIHEMTYQVNSANGCTSIATKTIFVSDLVSVDAGSDITVCNNDYIINLDNGISQGGGMWSGLNVDGNTFDPTQVDPGSYQVSYTYTSAYGCTSVDSKQITVLAPGTASIGSDLNICSTSTNIDLSLNASPVGGSFTGSGMLGSMFSPELAGIGSHLITYQAVNSNGCAISDSKLITVVEPMAIDVGENLAICVSKGAIDLDHDVETLGGFWSGSGVDGSFFTAGDAGVGTHALSYTYDDGFGCISVSNKSITVREDITVDAGSDLSTCINGGTIDLTLESNKIGGEWSGIGVSGDTFDPEDSGVGSFTLVYTFQDAIGCEATDTKTIEVLEEPYLDLGPNINTCTTAPTLDLSPLAFPSGGTFYGVGLSGSQFNPSMVSPGTYTITYLYTDSNGCEGSTSKDITVTQPEVIEVGSNEVLCLSSATIDLDASVSLLGGIWSGPGILSNRFDPLVAGVGSHALLYTYDDGLGCISYGNKNVTVRSDLVVDAGLDLTFCLFESPYDLTADGSIASGTWQGSGVSNRFFNPQDAGEGNHLVTYTYSDQFSCMASDTRIFTVYGATEIQTGGSLTVCNTSSNIDLASVVFPAGGTFSGAGVVGDIFNPSLVGNGVFEITYEYSDGNGCINSGVKEIVVESPAEIEAGDNFILCENSVPVDLDIDSSPKGGTWAGSAVINGFFDPSISGTGSFPLIYTLDDGQGCISTDTKIVTVREAISVSAGDPVSMCEFDDRYDLSNEPDQSGGIWLGKGIVNIDQFDPEQAGTGTHLLTYLYEDAFGCSASSTKIMTVNALPDVDSGPSIEICSTADLINLSLTVFPSGGTFTGPGVIGNTFDPSVVGVGSHTINYSYTNVSGCIGISERTIKVNAPPSIDAGDNIVTCLEGEIIDLNIGVSTTGGSWSGIGVVSGSFFDADIAGTGSYTLTYTYDNGLGCISTDTRTVTVRSPLSVVLSNDIPSVCANEDVINLVAYSNQPDGEWWGPGVSNNNFDPSLVSVGTHQLNYFYQDQFGCQYNGTISIDVLAEPLVDAGPLSSYCSTADTVDLSTSEFPGGGMWTGQGVFEGNMFVPSNTGEGDFDLTYTFTDSQGCSSSDSKSIIVNLPESIDAGENLITCLSNDLIELNLDVSITGGTWEGPGVVSDGLFSPDSVGEGSYTLTYTYDHGSSCVASDTRVITVNDAITLTTLPSDTICINIGDVDLEIYTNLSGGEWSGVGVSNGVFDPVESGIGVHSLRYEFRNEFGCYATKNQLLMVTSLPQVDAGPPATYCVTSDTIDLNPSGFPAGGYWTGQGVFDGYKFVPANVGIGGYQLQYHYNDNRGCQNSDIKEVTVTDPASIDAGENQVYCINQIPVDLDLDVSEIGGQWSGNGITNGSFFDPSSAGIGSHELLYTLNDGNGCIRNDTKTVTVKDAIDLDAGSDMVICESESSIDLQQLGSLQGGTWNGTGVSNNQFDPRVAGVGSYTISYTFDDEFGCSGSDELVITVLGGTQITAGPDVSICADSERYLLDADVFPVGGDFTGPGVIGNEFDASLVGQGTYEVQYSFTDNNGCITTASKQMVVEAKPLVEIGSNFDVCINSPVIDLREEATPVGGTFRGTGIIAGTFDPLSAGIGLHTISYSIVDDKGCGNIDSLAINVVDEPALQVGSPLQLCQDAAAYDLSDDVNLRGGQFAGTGITGNIFNPQDAGLGTFIITYTLRFNGCDLYGFREVSVRELKEVSFGEDIRICVDADPINLITEVSEVGGQYYGTGVIASIFYPDLAGIGSHEIEYHLLNEYGCVTVATKTIEVEDEIYIDAGEDLNVCNTVSYIELSEHGFPENGTYVGEGIENNILDATGLAVGEYWIQYYIDNGNGCISTDSLSLQVFSSNINDFGIDTLLCANVNELDLELNSELANGVWTGNGVVNNVFYPALAGIGEHVLSFESNNIDCKVAGTRRVTIVDLPENATLSTNNVNACVGDFIELNASLSVEEINLNSNVAWTEEGSDEPFAYGFNISFEVGGQEKIFCNSINQFGCISDQNNFVRVNIDNPSGRISIDTDSIGEGEFVELGLVDDQNVENYLWNFGDGFFSYEQSPSHYYYESGIYNIAVEISNSRGCNTLLFYEGLIVGRGDTPVVTSIEQANDLVIYPQPFSGLLKIEGGRNELVELIHLSGKKVNVAQKREGEVTELNTTDIPEGIYILKIGTNRIKIIKQ